jgi:8-amino-7-oxononanoate synthase
MKIEMKGKYLDNFCSNDYLGLSQHTHLKEKAAHYLDRYGSGSTASRLICGSTSVFEHLEKKLALFKGTEDSLIFNSGFQANISVIPALTDKRSIIFSDRLNHNSIIQGVLLARCDIVKYRHNDLNDLSEHLKRAAHSDYSRKVIVTESVFSMDGDISDIQQLVHLAEEHNAILIVDEAHATGVLGEKGSGLCNGQVDLVMGTFGKALGGFGSYIACSAQIKHYLINCCGGFIYTTALPPAVLGAIEGALELVPGMAKERSRLHDNCHKVRASLQKSGWDTINSNSQIIPVVIGTEEETLELSAYLENNGILATAIRPPTVERGKSRIRLTLSAAHSDDQLEHLMSVFNKWKTNQH